MVACPGHYGINSVLLPFCYSLRKEGHECTGFTFGRGARVDSYCPPPSLKFVRVLFCEPLVLIRYFVIEPNLIAWLILAPTIHF